MATFNELKEYLLEYEDLVLLFLIWVTLVKYLLLGQCIIVGLSLGGCREELFKIKFFRAVSDSQQNWRDGIDFLYTTFPHTCIVSLIINIL